MATTFTYSWATNEGPGGTKTSKGPMQSGPTTTARPETPAEENETARAANAAFLQAGIEPVPCRVDFFGADVAKVYPQAGPMRGKVITVRNF